ncbi:uncharacterized protein LOC116844125 [Odontomachus brunneus]|uniref:uncharacterized protein LOC116844125 n=1 Tax=Odontomachus brunneus TaxID=486640 RepID=UPI0013F1BE94|nr:uncharacterized protein LOC116844125 [Odontomachus brunneus]
MYPKRMLLFLLKYCISRVTYKSILQITHQLSSATINTLLIFSIDMLQFSSLLSLTYDFFNPNICHVCKTPLDFNKDFITCDQCHMISYCNSDHKLMNKECHMQICAAMKNVSKNHPHFWSTFGINLEEWIKTRKMFVRLVKLELQRDLEPYEEQMITLAKSCIICYHQTNLLHCIKCYYINYCRHHEKLLGNRHSINCSQLKLCLKTNTDITLYGVMRCRFAEFPNENIRIVDMNEFVRQFVYPIQCMYGNSPSMCLYYSDYVSGPLTLYYGVQIINELDSLDNPDSCTVIHIMNAHFVDRDYIAAWELLLHLLPNMKELKIILIGPELRTESGNLMVCSIKCFQRCLNFEIHHMLYHNYVNSEYYKQPNVIIGFQVDFSNWDTFSQSILKIRHQSCPFLLTSKTEHIAEQNLNKINEVLAEQCNVLYLLYNGPNSFNSHRPYVDFEDSGASYRNNFITIYKRLQ